MLQDFIESIEKLIDARLGDVHTAVPAEIVEFNQDDSTVDVVPKAKVVLSSGTEYDYPRINRVPLLFPCGSMLDASIVFPVKKGDGCLLIFSEQSLEYWKGLGITSSEMKFELSNAIAIPGLFAKPSSDIKEAIEKDSVIIRNGDNKISLSKSKIAITGDIVLEGNLTLTGEIKTSHNE